MNRYGIAHGFVFFLDNRSQPCGMTGNTLLFYDVRHDAKGLNRLAAISGHGFERRASRFRSAVFRVSLCRFHKRGGGNARRSADMEASNGQPARERHREAERLLKGGCATSMNPDSGRLIACFVAVRWKSRSACPHIRSNPWDLQEGQCAFRRV